VFYYINNYTLYRDGNIKLLANEGYDVGTKETGGFVYIENPQKIKQNSLKKFIF
jgi:hypothetical protein